jgi:hypothetical protein
MVGLSSHHGRRRQIRTEAAAFELNTGLLRSVRGKPSYFSWWDSAKDLPPYLWSQHHDVPINYVAQVENCDEVAVEDDIPRKELRSAA